MKYERITLKEFKAFGGDQVYTRLQELENKIENGTLIERNKPFVAKAGNSWFIYGVSVIFLKPFKTKAEAEKKLKELQSND